MEIKYNVTGTERKKLVLAIAEILECDAKYLSTPTFAYQVDYFTISKDGTLSFDDRADSDEVEQLIERLCEMGFEAEVKEASNNDAEVWAEREMRRLKLENANIPDYSNRGQYGGDYIPAFEDLQLTEGEELGLGRQRRENWQGENGMQASDVPETDDEDSNGEDNKLIIEMPRSFFTESALENLKRLVESKVSLFKKAFGTETVNLVFLEDRIQFPWFKIQSDIEAKAYTHFITALCELARTQKRVNASEKPVDNEKYTFRCFLLRLGFIGDEYKDVRKILLRNLSGSSAFRGGGKA